MRRVLLLLPAAAVLFGQTPPAAPDQASAPVSQNVPAEVDSALRERITQFFQMEVAGKFSQAYQLVADDTKDLFISSSKPSYTSFEIKTIKYNDDFTKAEVMLLVTRLLPIQGFMGHPMASKMTSRWKVENGQWCYFVDPQLDLPATPFGGLPVPGARAPMPIAGGSPIAQPPMPSHLADARMLTADKNSVQLKSSGPSSDQVTISNTSPWTEPLTLADPKIPGLTVKLTPMTVRPREKAILSVSSNGSVSAPKTPITIMVTVPQTKQNIPVTVGFTK